MKIELELELEKPSFPSEIGVVLPKGLNATPSKTHMIPTKDLTEAQAKAYAENYSAKFMEHWKSSNGTSSATSSRPPIPNPPVAPGTPSQVPGTSGIKKTA